MNRQKMGFIDYHEILIFKKYLFLKWNLRFMGNFAVIENTAMRLIRGIEVNPLTIVEMHSTEFDAFAPNRLRNTRESVQYELIYRCEAISLRKTHNGRAD